MSYSELILAKLDVLQKTVDTLAKSVANLTWDNAADPGPKPSPQPTWINGMSIPDIIGRVRLECQVALDLKYPANIYPQVKAIGHLHYVLPALETFPNISQECKDRIKVNCGGADMPGTFNRAFHYPNAPHSWERGDYLENTISFHEETLEEIAKRLEGFYLAALQQNSGQGNTSFSPGG